MIALTRKQVRRVDELAVEELGIPSLLLMENAGRGVADAVLDLLHHQRNITTRAAKASVICGGGNNGGDGYVVARHLHNAGVEVTLYAAVEPGTMAGDAKTNATIARKMGLPRGSLATDADLAAAAAHWRAGDVIIDALLGTGFTGPVRGSLVRIIEEINAARPKGPAVVAIDLPSGLDCDTGKPSNATVIADLTVTLVAPKIGFAVKEAAAYLGRVIVADIGAPPSLIDRVRKNA